MDCASQLWDGVLRRLTGELPAFTLEAWLRPLAPRLEPDNALTLLCPSTLHCERVGERYRAQIERHATEEAGRALRIAFVVGGSRRPPAQPEPPRREPIAAPAAKPRQVDFDHTFDNFVVGPCNRLAREAAFALAHRQERAANPLFLIGGGGLGKTHLARALVDESLRKGGARAFCGSAETFTNLFMTAVRGKQMERFKRRFRRECDLLVVEDVQFFSSKTQTQLELFHTITHLLDAGARVAFTGDRLPHEIEGMDPRLRSQMAAGLVAELERPDAEVRRRILRTKAARGGVRLPDECLELLVEGGSGSVRDLESVLIQLVASAALLERPIDPELTQAALTKLAPRGRESSALDPHVVVEVVAAFFKTDPSGLASRSRRRDILVPRQLAMYFCQRYTRSSSAAIGALFGRRHTAVNNAVRKVEREILERAPLRYQVELIARRLENKGGLRTREA